jgi:DNA repair exonuclease SbcCD nuclease subunit
MIMFKFLHAADIHLDSPLHKLDYYEGAPAEEIRRATRRALDNLVQTAIAEEVSFVLIAGDLYDGDWKDYHTGLYFVSQTSKLRDTNIPVYIVAGNHDAASKITKSLRLPQNVHLLPSSKPSTHRLEDLGVAIHGRSFATPAVKKDLSVDYPPPLPGYFNIGVLHTCASGREGHEPYAPCTLEGLRAKGYDYWALGHVHQFEVLSDDPPVVFSGNIQGRHIRETGPKGCVLVAVDDRGRPEPVFKPLDVIRWIVADVSAAGVESGFEAVDRTSERITQLVDENEGVPLVVRVIIAGETSAHSELGADAERWTNEIRSAVIDSSGERVWIEKVKIRTRLPGVEEPATIAAGALGELLRLFDELSSDRSQLAVLAGELHDLAKKLPREFKEGAGDIQLDDPEWLAGVLELVRPMLIRRLVRSGDSQ